VSVDETVDRLYTLLPAVYRTRDAARGQPLRALLAVVEAERARVEAELDGLYDDWFIETCADWVVPYIGNLLGVQGLHNPNSPAYDLRTLVANTLAYRRRKGTGFVLEQIARDVTDWPASRVVEFFQRLSTTQHLNHLRPENRTLSLRTMPWRAHDALDPPDDGSVRTVTRPDAHAAMAFDRSPHTAEFRASQSTAYNIPQVGLFIWRIAGYPVERAMPSRVDARYYRFNPLGLDAPLFILPETERDVTHLAEPVHVPAPLSRLALHDDLARLVAGGESAYFQPNRPVFQIEVSSRPDRGWQPIAANEVQICNLSGMPADNPLDGRGARVAVDPVTGRIALPPNPPAFLRVSYAYGFPGDVGGGPYDRAASVAEWFDPARRRVDWLIGVQHDRQAPNLPGVATGQVEIVASLSVAIQRWNAFQQANPGRFGVIAILDNASYPQPLPLIRVGTAERLAIVAATWSTLRQTDSGLDLQLVPRDLRPHIQGNLVVRGSNPPGQRGGELILDGLLIQGHLRVRDGNMQALGLHHCSLAPLRSNADDGHIIVETAADPRRRNDDLNVRVTRSIVGGLACRTSSGRPRSRAEFRLEDTIVDRRGETAIDCPASAVVVARSTVFGTVTVEQLSADDTLFTDLVSVARQQTGCLRFCYVAPDSVTPRRFRCQPDLLLRQEADRRGVGIGDLSTDDISAVEARVRPRFSAARYGHYAYGQLSRLAAAEIRQGAENESEMGAFNYLLSPHREANLHSILREYLPFGLSASILYVT
jgi:hypothetical protein